MLHESCTFYRFLPRRRPRSTNFYRAGASVLPISTVFYRAAVAVLPEQKPNKSTTRKHKSTNFYRAVFEIIPLSTGRFSKFYRVLPVSACVHFYRILPDSAGPSADRVVFCELQADSRLERRLHTAESAKIATRPWPPAKRSAATQAAAYCRGRPRC